MSNLGDVALRGNLVALRSAAAHHDRGRGFDLDPDPDPDLDS
jgi:hypothetical protein